MVRLRVPLVLAVTFTLCNGRQAASAYGSETCALTADAPEHDLSVSLSLLRQLACSGSGCSDHDISVSRSLLRQLACTGSGKLADDHSLLQHQRSRTAAQAGLSLLQRSRTSAKVGSRSRQPPGPGGKGPFIAYLSAVGNYERRAQVRKKCLTEAKERNIPYLFFLGRPNYPDSDHPVHQGAIATPKEIEATEQLRKEQAEFQDIHVVPYADHYSDLSDKVASLFDYGLDAGYDLIVKIDDDQCLNFGTLAKVAAEAKDDVALYVGGYLWNGTEYPSMVGATGEHVQYMAGPCFMSSRRLVGIVFRDRAFDTELYQGYGTSSDDNNMGRWYQRALEAQSNSSSFKDVRFDRRVEPGMCSSALDGGQ